MSGDVYLLPTFAFRVTLSRVSGGDPDPAALDHEGKFAECTGLQLEADVKEYLEGGRNDGVIRRAGRVKLVPLVLKRGMFTTDPSGGSGKAVGALWSWLTGMVGGERPVARYDGRVEILDGSRAHTLATWTFDRGLPIKIAGPTLNAKTGEIAIEELQIAHEGLRMVLPTRTGASA
ncbi:phage tail protein [Cellulomonas sp. NPDC055163]